MTERRDKTRKSASSYLIVFDTRTDLPLGRVVNLSETGMMLISQDPMEASQSYSCRMALPEKLLDKRMVVFEADSKWCRFNDLANVYQTGYEFSTMSEQDLEVIRLLTHDWTVEDSDGLELNLESKVFKN